MASEVACATDWTLLLLVEAGAMRVELRRDTATGMAARRATRGELWTRVRRVRLSARRWAIWVLVYGAQLRL
jgi:hypothetical protein